MRTHKKSRLFVLFYFLFCFTPVISACGYCGYNAPLENNASLEIDVKKAIIGKWERYDEELCGTESLEFFEDGTLTSYCSKLNLWASGDYRFVSKNRIRLDLRGLWGLLGPIVCGVSVSRDELILTMPGEEVERYKRVGKRNKKR